MNDASEFTNDWALFEERLSGFLAYLVKPTLNDTVRLRYPTGEGAFGEIILQDTFSGAADIGQDFDDDAFLMDLIVRLPDRPPRLYPVPLDAEELPDAARDVCEFLRDEALVPHPSFLTGESERIGEWMLARLGIAGHDGVLHEAVGLTAAPSLPDLSWPQSFDETSAALEAVLTMKYGAVNLDADGDYVIDTTAGGGARFYITVIDDGAAIALRKVVVGVVNSRRSAVTEANYLNRKHSDIRWVLRGHTLSQEYHFPTAPFVPIRFGAMLDRFGASYRAHVSALRMRLGGDL